MRSQNEASPIHAKRTNRGHSDDASRNVEDPDALEEQEKFDNHLPDPVHEQPQHAIPEQSDFEELHADHGIIYYERQKK